MPFWWVLSNFPRHNIYIYVCVCVSVCVWVWVWVCGCVTCRTCVCVYMDAKCFQGAATWTPPSIISTLQTLMAQSIIFGHVVYVKQLLCVCGLIIGSLCMYSPICSLPFLLVTYIYNMMLHIFFHLVHLFGDYMCRLRIR